MRSIIFAALLLIVCHTPTSAQESGGVPGVGAVINLKPTKFGYEGDILLPSGKYAGASLASSDPIISKLLIQRVEMREETRVPQTSFVSLVTVVLNSGAVPQGQYRFTLKLSGTEPVTRDLFLLVPASHVDTLDTLVVVSEWGKPGSFGKSRTANQPQIWETSQKGWLTHLTLDQKGQTDAGSDPAGRIKPKNPNLADIGPGKNELILLGRDYDLDGSFPLGAAKGKLVLKADQLSDPVTFNFEVRSRMWIARR
jgi:hypothetical protein